MLRALRVGVGIVTETHMRKAELGGLTFSDYYIRGELCRPTPQRGRIGMGVLILVHRGLTTEGVERSKEIDAAQGHCVIRLSPAEDPCAEMRITGMFASPTKTGELEKFLRAHTKHPLMEEGGECPEP